MARARVRPRGDALADILSELAARGIECPEAEVEGVLDVLYDAYEKDGTVPTRESFAKAASNTEAGEAVRGMARDPFAAKSVGKGRIAAICAGLAIVVALAGGIWWAAGDHPQASAGSDGTVVAADADQDEEANEGQREADEGGESVDEGTESLNSEADGTDQTSGGGSAASGSGIDSASSGGSSGSASTGSGSSGSSSAGGSSGSGSSQSQHAHNWVAQTTTVHHDAVYKTVHHDAVTEQRTICNNCGADITGNVDAHMKANILNGCGSYSVKTVVVQAAYDEQVLVSAAWDETVTTGYKCSGCGATK